MRRCPSRGLAAFARQALREGELVERSPCVEVSRRWLLPAAAAGGRSGSGSGLSLSSSMLSGAAKRPAGRRAETTESEALDFNSSTMGGAGGGVNLLDYLFEIPETLASSRTRDATLLLPLGSALAFNHGPGEACNVDFDVRLISNESDSTGRSFESPTHSFEILFYALREVSEGEELLIDYGEEWWSNRGWKPLSPGLRSRGPGPGRSAVR